MCVLGPFVIILVSQFAKTFVNACRADGCGRGVGRAWITLVINVTAAGAHPKFSHWTSSTHFAVGQKIYFILFFPTSVLKFAIVIAVKRAGYARAVTGRSAEGNGGGVGGAGITSHVGPIYGIKKVGFTEAAGIGDRGNGGCEAVCWAGRAC